MCDSPDGKRLERRRGFALVLALLMLLTVTVIGLSSVGTAVFQATVVGNKRISEQAFYVSEAGVNEFIGRFRPGAMGEISDLSPTHPDWRLFVATEIQRAAQVGYVGDDPNHTWVQSLQTHLDFGVRIQHKLDIDGQVLMRGGNPVYVVTSRGLTREGGRKDIQVEVIRIPNMDPSAALYSKAPVWVQGSSTIISGYDRCPDGAPHDKPGIVTTTSSITESGHPIIEGSPEARIIHGPDIPLRDIVDYLKTGADFAYDYSANQTLTGYSDSWGIPTLPGHGEPLSYEGEMHIVYFNMNGDHTLKLAGGSHGAGILLVDGNLEINGGFSWYGLIVVTGAMDYAGGGEKNVTGAVLSGESTTLSVEVGGNASILYCSQAIRDLTAGLPPIRITQWREGGVSIPLADE